MAAAGDVAITYLVAIDSYFPACSSVKRHQDGRYSEPLPLPCAWSNGGRIKKSNHFLMKLKSIISWARRKTYPLLCNSLVKAFPLNLFSFSWATPALSRVLTNCVRHSDDHYHYFPLEMLPLAQPSFLKGDTKTRHGVPPGTDRRMTSIVLQATLQLTWPCSLKQHRLSLFSLYFITVYLFCFGKEVEVKLNYQYFLVSPPVSL